MKKKLGEFTLAEIKRICTEQESCYDCPFWNKDADDQCGFDEMVRRPFEMDVDGEVEIEEEEKE